MKKLDHIGIGVRNLDEACRKFSKLLGTTHYKVETIVTERVKVAFFMVGDVKIELLEATHPESPITRFISNRGEGIHHIAFEVKDDLEKELTRLSDEGFRPVYPVPEEGADHKQVCFLHPKSCHGVLVELCQEKPSVVD